MDEREIQDAFEVYRSTDLMAAALDGQTLQQSVQPTFRAGWRMGRALLLAELMAAELDWTGMTRGDWMLAYA